MKKAIVSILFSVCLGLIGGMVVLNIGKLAGVAKQHIIHSDDRIKQLEQEIIRIKKAITSIKDQASGYGMVIEWEDEK